MVNMQYYTSKTDGMQASLQQVERNVDGSTLPSKSPACRLIWRRKAAVSRLHIGLSKCILFL